MDKVHEMNHKGSKASLRLADGKSVVSKVFSVKKSEKAPSSVKSSLSRVFMRNLQKELEDEKKAREKLEKEIAEIKKINSELSTTLGLLAK